jgi:4-amino-4-deoxy-L-arabinose transferase-like glycosyltransferase
MPGSADFIQRAVHALEAGALAVWIRRAAVVTVLLAIALFYLLHEFRGLATSQGMDQAQIGREIASGHGWTTNLIRPRAVGQLKSHGKDVTAQIRYDTYHAPLPPLVDALALLPVRAHWKMDSREPIYAGDNAIAIMAMLLFLASVVMLFFIAQRVFDRRLAFLGCGLVLVCDLFWEYSLSGLPQMLLLLLFNTTIYFIVRAVQARYEEKRVAVWLAASGAGFGLLALSHALTIWIFVAAFIFFAFFFRPRGWPAMIMLLAFAVVYTPWLVRNWAVCGNPAGVAVYAVYDGIKHPEAGHMRRVAVDLQDVTPGYFRNKITGNLLSQAGRIFQYLGFSFAAAMFFGSLLHGFKRPETAMLRWILLAMWAGAVLGMATYGITDEQGVAANQLHILFIPMMTCFGLAFLLVQWSRLEIEMPLARGGFLALLFLLCAMPMIFTMIGPRKASVRWPPYVPPYIAVLNDWMKPEEIIASDMPWAVAWYANRRSLWLPENLQTMVEFSDYNTVGGPVNGLYLTPVSGGQNTLTDIVKGEYKDWAQVILRSVDLTKFPLKWATVGLGVESECVFFSDHDRSRPPGS